MQLTLPTDREQLVVWFDTFLDTDDIDIFQVSSSLGDSIVTLAKDIGYTRSDELDKAYWNKLFTAIAKIQKGTVNRAFGCRDVVRVQNIFLHRRDFQLGESCMRMASSM